MNTPVPQGLYSIPAHSTLYLKPDRYWYLYIIPYIYIKMEMSFGLTVQKFLRLSADKLLDY